MDAASRGRRCDLLTIGIKDVVGSQPEVPALDGSQAFADGDVSLRVEPFWPIAGIHRGCQP